jgi:hypothetical protein
VAERRWADAAALGLLSVGGVAAWWGALGDGLLWLAPVIAVAALTTAGALRVRVAMGVALLWLPGSILAAGLGTGALAPAALYNTSAALHVGLEALPTIDSASPVMQIWALAAVLLIAGTTFGLAGILWRGAVWWRTLGGFAMLLVPLGAAVATQQTPDASWIGALVLVAVVLRVAHGRTIPIVATAAVVGAVALFGAQVAAPRAGWAPFGHSQLAQFHELDTTQTYGPLEDSRTGAVMLDVTAKQPALWRMQVLEAFAGWSPAKRPTSPNRRRRGARRPSWCAGCATAASSRRGGSPRCSGPAGRCRSPGTPAPSSPNRGKGTPTRSKRRRCTRRRRGWRGSRSRRGINTSRSPSSGSAGRRSTSRSHWRAWRKACRRRYRGPIGDGCSTWPGNCRAGSSRS